MASPTHGSPKLRTVCNELEEVKHKAHEIGIQLGVPLSKMMQFKQEGNVLTAAINFWLRGNVEDDDIPVKWSSIVVALESKQVGESGLARTIHNKFCREQKQTKDDKVLCDNSETTEPNCEATAIDSASSESVPMDVEPFAPKLLDISSDDDSMPLAKRFCEEQAISEIDVKTKICASSGEAKASSSPVNKDINSTSTKAKKSYNIVLPEFRKYQLELAQPGINGENYIIVAPTGCGKTAVAALVISNHLKKNKGHVIFIVRNRVLAVQQDDKLSSYIPDSEVDHCIGGGSLDVFESIKYNDITVCTAGKLLEELKKGLVSFDDIGLLVFDECHNTLVQQAGEHNYAQIMYLLFEHREINGHQPQVIGMTASPGAGKNPQVTVERTIDHLKNLMAVLDATSGIITVSENVEELHRKSPATSFSHNFVKSREVEDDPLVSAVSMEMSKLEAKITDEKIYAAKWSQKYLTQVGGLQKVYEESDDKSLRDSISALSLLACYCRALMNYMELDMIDAIATIKDFNGVSVDDEVTPYEKVIMNNRSLLLEKLRSVDLKDNSFLDKMRELLWDDDKCEPRFSRGMVFVHTKKYAYSLCDWAKKHPNLGEEIKPVVITGHTGVGSMSQDEQKDIIGGFRKGETNLLIATSVAEEGLDVPDCNLVIRYHYVTGSVSKRQVEGRIRAEDGQGFTILASNSKKRYTDLRNEELNQLVDKILDRNMLPTGAELKEVIQKVQHEIMEKRKKEAAQKVVMKKYSEGKNVTLICRKCKVFVCHGSDIYKVDNHHIVPDPSFLEKVKVSENRKKGEFVVPHKVIKKGKMQCKACSMDWGNICTFNDYNCDLPLLKCANFTFKMDGRTQKWRQWKDVPYEVQQLDLKMKLASDQQQ